MARRSFFEKLTGTIRLDDDFSQYEPEDTPVLSDTQKSVGWKQDDIDGELAVDVYQNNTHIIVKTMIAGVRPDDIDIQITRDTVTIRGKREDEKEIRHEDYYHKELYWGSFSRTIVLPAEVEAEEAEASERHGLLIIKIPKIDKHKQTKLKIRSN